MRILPLSVFLLAVGISGCRADDTQVIADGPTEPRQFLCEDGREVSYVAMMGGTVLVTLGEQVTEMQQIYETTLDGHVHVGGGLVWITHLQGKAEIADLAPGQAVDDVQRIPCTEVVE